MTMDSLITLFFLSNLFYIIEQRIVHLSLTQKCLALALVWQNFFLSGNNTKVPLLLIRMKCSETIFLTFLCGHFSTSKTVREKKQADILEHFDKGEPKKNEAA